MIFALVGNQNCGKTTLFNALTGLNQHVGNFPGVTVSQKVGVLKKTSDFFIVDLPGTYSLSPYSKEESITRDFLLNKKPDGIINIVDATNIERNLYLTMQLLELNTPIIVVLNMMDEVKINKGSIDIEKLSAELNVPVIPISAIKNQGISDVINVIINLSTSKPQKKLIKSYNFSTEGETLSLATIRYKTIEKICKKTVIKPEESKQHKQSRLIDKILTNKYLGIPIFFIIMFLIFFLTFNIIGSSLSNYLAYGIDYITNLVDNLLTTYKVNPIIHSLIIDGIFRGVGSVLSFLPVIIVLFFFLSILEDTGYMARIAFIMDGLLKKIGLSGKSIVPMLLGFGCSVPAIMSTRTLLSNRDRIITIMLIPYMSCSAKIPIYAMFSLTFFGKYSSLVMIILYIIGIFVGILIALFIKNNILYKKNSQFIMELPNYRFPSLKNIIFLIRDKAKDFIEKAFSLIFIATIIIWFLENFDINLNLVINSSNSILAHFSKLITPIFTPLGFSDWKIVSSLISGLSAKETVISTLSILLNDGTSNLNYLLTTLFTPITAFSFLIFTLLYTPCIATIITIYKELKSVTKTLFIIIFQCIVAWSASFISFNILSFITNL